MTYNKLTIVEVVLSAFALSCCSKAPVETGETQLIHETKFNSAYIALQNEDMDKLGFSFGDSCDVYFSNGQSMHDIPYYDGYYTRSDFPLICGYQGYPYVQITINNSSNFWDMYALQETYTVNIKLNTKGKYLDAQQAFSMHYSNDRNQFTSDAEFANFREVKTTNIKEGRLYRGASPFNDCYSRAHYVDNLLKEKGAKFILDLSDSAADIEDYKSKYDLTDNYALQQDKVYCSMGSNFRVDRDTDEAEPNLFTTFIESDFKTSLGKGLKEMIESSGPYYVHCVEGKDRTGFVCMLLEAVSGASYSEMKKDYMITYSNYFGIQEGDVKYDAVCNLRFDEFMEYLSDSASDLASYNYVNDAKDYLRACNLTDAEIDQLIDCLTK